MLHESICVKRGKVNFYRIKKMNTAYTDSSKRGESIDVEYRYKEVVSVNGKKRIVAISSFRSRGDYAYAYAVDQKRVCCKII